MSSIVKTNGELAALEMPALLAEYKALGVEYDRLVERLRRVTDERGADVIRRQIEELTGKVGSLTASMDYERDAKEKLAGDMKDLRDKLESQVNSMKQLIAAKDETIKVLDKRADLAEGTLSLLQAQRIGIAWTPVFIAIVIILGLCFRGSLMPATGDAKLDEITVLSNLQQMEYQRRERDMESQKPHDVWGSTKVFTSDKKGIVMFQAYGAALSSDKSIELNQAIGCILSSFRAKTAVGANLDDKFFLAKANSKNPEYIQTPEQLNDLVGKRICEMMADSGLEFSWNIQMEFLEAKSEQNRRWGMGGDFKNGKFQPNTGGKG